VKDDRDVTASDIANNNLILFGDPWSNQLIARIIGKLPQWTRQEITLGGRTVDGRNTCAGADLPESSEPEPIRRHQ